MDESLQRWQSHPVKLYLIVDRFKREYAFYLTMSKTEEIARVGERVYNNIHKYASGKYYISVMYTLSADWQNADYTRIDNVNPVFHNHLRAKPAVLFYVRCINKYVGPSTLIHAIDQVCRHMQKMEQLIYVGQDFDDMKTILCGMEHSVDHHDTPAGETTIEVPF